MRLTGWVAVVLIGGLAGFARGENFEYLSDRSDLLVHVSQGWGELGIDRGAHAPGQPGAPLRVDSRNYNKGLGHHANGEIVVELAGRYSHFECEVGVLAPQPAGSVVFRVVVDEKKVFDSGVMRQGDAPKPVSVPVAGAQELKLVLKDANDGINCDAGVWGKARLLFDPSLRAVPTSERFDVARFARVITGDPGRLIGATRTRIQEFLADELFLDTDVYPDDQGNYVVKPSEDGRVAIGLRWTERRFVRLLDIEFAPPAPVELAERAEVQFWIGKSPYQGQWKTLNGTLIPRDNRWTFRVNTRANPDLRNGTWKVRWILPTADDSLTIRRLQAHTASIIKTTDLVLQFEGDAASEKTELELYDAEFVEPAEFAGQARARVDAGASISLNIRYIDRRSWQSDRAVLRIRQERRAFAVGIDDVLKNRAVYVPAQQAMVSLADAKLTMAAYREQIAGKKTILDQVRSLPDQTFAQAIEKVHRVEQNRQPTMLSLACDNNKFIVHRDGVVSFEMFSSPDDQTAPDTGAYPSSVRPVCGSGKNEKIERHLDGGWYPVSVVTIEDGGVSYRQTAFVVPYDRTAKVDNPWLNPKPLFVAAYAIENTASAPADASLQLKMLAHVQTKKAAAISVNESRALARADDRLMAAVDAASAGPLRLSDKDGAIALAGQLAAGQKVECVLYIPGWKMSPDEAVSLTGGAGLVADCKTYWDRVMAGAMQVHVPDELLNNVIKASQVHCMMAARNEAGGQRVAPWIASVSYGPLESESNSIIRGMSAFGHEEFARRSLDFFVNKYDPAGFLTTGYTLMGTGWHLWTLGEHYRMAGDTEWFKSIAPKVANVCMWITKQREKTKRSDARGQLPLEAGLMPPGVMADWDVFAFYMYLNGVTYAGLRDAGWAIAQAAASGTGVYEREAEGFRDDILRAYRAMQAITPVFGLRNGTFVTPYPSQLLPGPTAMFFPGEDGNRSWCYDVELGAHHLVPYGVLSPDDPDVEDMMNHMEDVQFLSEGWFDYPAAENEKDPYNFGGFAKVQPYYARNAEVCVMRDDVKPFVRSYFNTIPSLLGMETLSFQEHFRGVAAWNKTHETGYFLHQSRIMLVMERGRELWLAPLVTNNWLKDGMAIEVKNAPTFFGPVGYRIESRVADGTIEATISPSTRVMPKQIVLRLRHPDGKPIRKVTVNGRDHADFNPAKEIIRLEPTKETIQVRAEF